MQMPAIKKNDLVQNLQELSTGVANNILARAQHISKTSKKLACGVLIAASIASPIFSEVLFTDRAKENPAAIEKFMQAWNELNQAEPENVANLWLKKPSDQGYIGDVTVDFDAQILGAANWVGRGVFNPDRTIEQLTEDINHELGGHAIQAHIMDAQYTQAILPPILAVFDNMLREGYAHLNEMKSIEHSGTYQDAIDHMDLTKEPSTDRDPYAYFILLKKYNKVHNPNLSEQEILNMTANKFMINFVTHKSYLDDSVDNLDVLKVYTFNEVCTQWPGSLSPKNLIFWDYYGDIMKDLMTSYNETYKVNIDYDRVFNSFAANLENFDKARAVQGKVTVMDLNKQLLAAAEMPKTSGSYKSLSKEARARFMAVVEKAQAEQTNTAKKATTLNDILLTSLETR